MARVVITRSPALVRYVVAQDVTITATCYNDADALADPSGGVTITTTHPEGADVEETTANPSTGVYTATVTLDNDGRWKFHAQALGDNIAADRLSIAVVDAGLSEVPADEEAILAPLDAELGSVMQKGPTVWQQKRGWIIINPSGAVDIAAELDAAVNSRDGVCVEIAEGVSTLATPVNITSAYAAIVGRGSASSRVVLGGSSNQTYLSASDASGLRIENLYFERSSMTTAVPSGYIIKLTGCFGSRIEHIWADRCENGIWLCNCTDSIVRDFKPRDSFGNRGILVGSTTDYGNQNYVYDLRDEGGGYPGGYPAAFSASMAAAWSSGEVISAGAIRVVAGVLIWQCTTGGTCDTTNATLTSLPSSNPISARSTTVANGSAVFRYVGRADRIGLCAESYSGDIFAENVVVLNGGLAYATLDTLSPGHPPSIQRILGLVADHVLDYGANVSVGSDIKIQGEVLTLREVGIAIGTGVYDWELHRVKALGCAKEGIFANSGDGSITRCTVGHNSQKTNNTYDGILIAGDYVTCTNNISGNPWDGDTDTPQRYGINLASGSGCTVANNRLHGNTTGPLLDAGTAPKVIAGNNPDPWRVERAGLTANIAATGIFPSTPTAGEYRFDCIIEVKTVGTLGSIVLTLRTVEATGTLVTSTTAINITGTGRQTARFFTRLTGASNPTYEVTGITTPGTLSYDVVIVPALV